MKQPVIEEVVRFETEPGEQMQAEFTIIRQGHNPLLAFVATLGWSHATLVRFCACQDSAAWCDGIESTLHFFGGTPRQMLFDNARAIIIERDVYGPGKHRWNPQLIPLSEKYAFSAGSAALTERRPKARWNILTTILTTALSCR